MHDNHSDSTQHKAGSSTETHSEEEVTRDVDLAAAALNPLVHEEGPSTTAGDSPSDLFPSQVAWDAPRPSASSLLNAELLATLVKDRELAQSQPALPTSSESSVSMEELHASDLHQPAKELEVVVEPPAQMPGELLLARRLQLRLSVEEAAARVKLAPRQLLALEANDFEALPGMAVVRGFIRSYAKALNMPPEPLLALVTNEPNPAFAPLVLRRPLPTQGFPGRRYSPSSSHRRGSKRLSSYAIVIFIFVATLAYIAYSKQWFSLPQLNVAETRANLISSLPLAKEAENLMDVASEAAKSVRRDLSTESATTDSSVTAVTSDAPTDSAQISSDANRLLALSPAEAAAADPSRVLEIRLREDAWIEISTQTDESKLVSRLMKAGISEKFEIKEPVILVVGNATGVDVLWHGQAVNLKLSARDNVAKLTLK